jgi:hypothetical protein
MSFKLTGKIKKIDATVQVSEKFSKREVVVTDESSMYPQDILFQATQDKCALLDTFSVGDIIDVSFNLRGREWTSPQGEVKYFNTLEGWRFEKAGASTSAPTNNSAPAASNSTPTSTPAPAPASAAQPQDSMVSSTGDDDLPF